MLSPSEGGILTLYFIMGSVWVHCSTDIGISQSIGGTDFIFMDKISIFAVAVFCRSELAVPESV